MKYVLPLLSVLPFAAQAQEGPSFDCTFAESAAEQLVCEDESLAALDRRVGELFQEALATVEALDVGAEAARDRLIAVQRGWLGGRDECWKAEDLADCVAFSYLRREGELVATYMLAEPVRTEFWACDGNAANEVAIMAFDTSRETLRLERGDSVMTAMADEAGSGRYDGDFGMSFEIDGDTATYRAPDPDGSEITCMPAG